MKQFYKLIKGTVRRVGDLFVLDFRPRASNVFMPQLCTENQHCDTSAMTVFIHNTAG